MSPSFISSNDFVVKWAEALNVDPAEVSRIVIDAKVGNVLVIHVQKVGSTAMLEVVPPTEGVEVRVVP